MNLLSYLGPEVLLVVGVLVAMLGIVVIPQWKALPYGFGVVFVIAAAIWDLRLVGPPHYLLGQALMVDNFSVLISFIVLVAALATLLLGWEPSRIEPEFPLLVLLSAVGMMALGMAGNLLVIFLGVEVLSLPLYIMTAIGHTPEGGEAGIKYLLLGAFSSGIMLFGMALLYGGTGTLNFTGAPAPGAASAGLVTVGMALLLVGLLFKLAIVPFHMWVPDVYQGAPTPVTALMAVGTKVAAAAALLRVFAFASYVAPTVWGPLIGYLAVLTIVVGNLLALTQTDMKRLLAYSGIGNAGYVLIGLATQTIAGLTSMSFFLIPYGVAAMGFLAVHRILEGKGLEREQLQGLAYRHPWVAVAFVTALLSLAGIPLTGGFIGKLYLIEAAIFAHHPGLAVGIVLGSVIGLVAYLRPVQLLFTRSDAVAVTPNFKAPSVVVLVVMTVVTVGLGVFPSPVVHWVNAAASFSWLQ